MAGERDMSRVMRQMLHKKQERTQTIQSEEPRINDLKEGFASLVSVLSSSEKMRSMTLFFVSPERFWNEFFLIFLFIRSQLYDLYK